MLDTLWTKTLRDYRVAILGWGVGLGFLLWAQYVAYTSMSAAGRSAEAELARSYRFFADPIAVDTAAGYTHWHVMGYMPVLLGIWAVLAGSRLIRGEEERGSLDLLLATPLTRIHVLVEKLAGLILALVAIACLMAAGLVIGEATSNDSVDVGRAVSATLNVGLGALVFGSLALFLSQLLTSRAAAAGWAGGVMVLTYLLDSTGRIIDNGEWLQRLTPLYYYNLSKPLIPSYGTNLGAVAVLLILCALLAGACLPLFARRDIGGTAWQAGRKAPRIVDEQARAGALERARRDGWGHGIALREIRAEAAAVFWWLIGLTILAGYVTAIVPTFRDAYNKVVSSNPLFAKVLGQYDISSDNGLLAAVAFLYLPVVTVIFAVTIAVRWPRDLDDGRLDLVLATPRGRRSVYMERFGAVTVATVIAPLAIWLCMVAATAAVGLHVDLGRLSSAIIGMVPLELITAAMIYLLAGWLRGPAVLGLATGLVALSFFAEFLQALLKLPDWLIALSIFHQYGNPMINDVHWGAWLLIVTIAGALLLIGAERFARRDLLSGS